MINITNNPCLRYLLTAAIKALTALFKEAPVQLHTVALRRAHWFPVTGLIVSHQNAANDAHPIIRRIATITVQCVDPWIVGFGPYPLGQKVRIVVSRPQRTSLRHGGDPQWRPTLLHISWGNFYILKMVALSCIAKALAGKAALQHLDAFIHQGNAAWDRYTKAFKLVRGIAHTNTQIDTSAG